MRFSVNLSKALLAIVATFFSRDAIILSCICCFLWHPKAPSLEIDGSKIDLYYGLFIRLPQKDLQHYMLVPHWLLMGTIKEWLNSSYPFLFSNSLGIIYQLDFQMIRFLFWTIQEMFCKTHISSVREVHISPHTVKIIKCLL